jgi:hypothetical protein
MAVNRSRDMNSELHLGLVENSYIRLDPNRGGIVEHDKAERLSWPTYHLAETSPHSSHTNCGCDGRRNSSHDSYHDQVVQRVPLLGTQDPPRSYR